jgi:tripartite-type tricarboxylate transporter receptor subunit TctC
MADTLHGILTGFNIHYCVGNPACGRGNGDGAMKPRNLWAMLLMLPFVTQETVPSQAQDYPTRSVSMVVAAAAGGPIDVFARVLADGMSPAMGQRVVVENVPGGGGTIGGQRVVRAAPDGYVTLLGTVATHTNPQLYSDKALYNPLTDLEPVGLIAEIPLILIARKDFPAKNFEEFVAYAKANPGKLNYGSAGVGSAAHLGCVLLEQGIGAKLQHVPYRGTGPAMQDLLAGRLDIICDIAVTAVQNIGNGTVKGLANLSSERSAALPDLPTAVEKGYPSVQASTWTALFVPKGTPASVATKLNAAMIAAMSSPGFGDQVKKLAATMVSPERRSQAYLAGFVKSEWDKWGKAIRAADAIPK